MRSTMFDGKLRERKPVGVMAAKKPGGMLARREVVAEVFGHWALHHTLDDKGREISDEWSVTHVPTGLAAATHMDRGTALRVVEMMHAQLNVEVWDKDKHTPIAELEIKRIRGWI